MSQRTNCVSDGSAGSPSDSWCAQNYDTHPDGEFESGMGITVDYCATNAVANKCTCGSEGEIVDSGSIYKSTLSGCTGNAEFGRKCQAVVWGLATDCMTSSFATATCTTDSDCVAGDDSCSSVTGGGEPLSNIQCTNYKARRPSPFFFLS